MSRPQQHILLADIHYPYYDRSAWAAVLDYVKKNRVDGVVFMGDAMDFDAISHHNIDRPLYRTQGALKSNVDGFVRDILIPLESLLPKKADRRYLLGNHERFLTQDLIEAQPELDGMFDIGQMLGLDDFGYTVIPQGGFTQIGHLYLAHGDCIGGGQNPAKKAVDVWGKNICIGHFHTASSYTKSSPASQSDRFTGTVLPCLSTTDPKYARGRANTHLTGMGICDVRDDGAFNLFTAVILNGQFSYGGATYGKKTR